MQCAACHTEYSDALDDCPQCSQSSSSSALPSEKRAARATRAEARANSSSAVSAPANSGETATATATQAPPVSTLIEFPGAGRAPRPQWRKDLSERVREIQQRRAREAEQEAAFAAVQQTTTTSHHTTSDDAEEALPAPTLGLVPPLTDAPEPNPIVVAALRRIERARQPSPPPSKPRGMSNGAATAAALAYVPEENLQAHEESAPFAATSRAERAPARSSSSSSVSAGETKGAHESSKAETSNEAVRPSTLVVVSTQPPAKAEALADLPKSNPSASRTANASATAELDMKVRADAKTTTTSAGTSVSNSAKVRRAEPGILDAASIERREAEITDAANTVPVVQTYNFNDRAPMPRRIVAAAADLLLTAIFSIPFAAIIELTSGHWGDIRVQATMGSIFLLVMFLYLVVSTGLVGRTLGMWLFSLRAVDERSALVPTTGQSIRRALLYMLSLITLGVGLIYAFFDAEGRTAHDHFSGTVVVRE